MTSRRQVLEATSFGKRIAEEEIDELSEYFVETNQWREIFAGEKDVVFGDKGAGKSAIYSLLVSRINELFDRGVIVIPGEKPRGTPAFSGLVVDPPATEPEFVGLWKLYFLCLIGTALRDYGIPGESAGRVVTALESAGLIEKGPLSLQSVIRGALDYVRSLLKWESVEGGLKIDPSTGLPTGVTGKITLREPSADQRRAGLESIDTLLGAADDALAEAGVQLWVVLDRLDVAFADSDDVEGNALRALFMVYGDFREYGHLELKIFLRSDIWGQVTAGGLRETSHIEDQVTITWDPQTLLNLVIRRCVKNESIRSFYNVTAEDILADVVRQRELFDRIFPPQVEAGTRKSTTFDWMLGRVRDGTGRVAPRELIHLLASLRAIQLRLLEIGAPEPPDEQLFDRSAFKAALVEVSRTRLEQTLLPEYPDLRRYIEKLERRKTLQTAASLSSIWGCSADEAESVATRLVEVGFFERRQTQDGHGYWVPFLYRDALELVQGTEGGGTDENEQLDLESSGAAG